MAVEAPLAEPELSEADLVARARAGDPAAFEAIVQQFGARAYRIVAAALGPTEAEDAAQEVFVQVHRGLPRFEGRAALGTWIHRIAVNVALKRLRRRKRKPTPALLEDDAAASRRPGPQARAEAEELRVAFREALAALPDEQRAVVVLRGVEGLSFDEVARALEIPVPTAQSRMSRARERLRGLLSRFLEGPS